MLLAKFSHKTLSASPAPVMQLKEFFEICGERSVRLFAFHCRRTFERAELIEQQNGK